jgi:RNA methyltransferase, TrmH family
MLSKALIKQLRSLQMKKFRDIEQLFVVEGPKMLDELANSPQWQIDHIYSTNEQLISSLNAFSPFTIINEKELQQISGLATPNKVLATVKYRTPDSDSLNILSGFYLLLDKIQDPGNLGTIIRIADWFGVDGIICSKETADYYNPKVIQSSMGSVFRVPVFYEDLSGILEHNLKTAKLPVFAAMLEGDSLYKTAIDQNAFLLLGNESNGVNQDLNKFITNKIHIPTGKPSGQTAESLNVAIAAAIICSEWARGK